MSKFSYDDISIVPETITHIYSRSQCNIYDENDMLPIFTAPMDTVVCENNIEYFIKNNINVVIPRDLKDQSNKINTNILYRLNLGLKYNCFVALSMLEANTIFIQNKNFLAENNFNPDKMKICIDLANGHMKALLLLIEEIKNKYRNIVIMSGNIANPNTYVEYNACGCDYVRVGIGGGSACLTSSNTGVYFPYFSLIEEMFYLKEKIGGKCKIIADGNIRGFRDIQKALIFADYVMIGSIFNKAIESAGQTTYGNFYWNFKNFRMIDPIKTLLFKGRNVNQFDKSIIKKWNEGKFDLYKEFYGMSTKVAQKAMNPNSTKLKTSEGLVKRQKVEYSITKWVENECDYLKSAMSYTNSLNLNEYKNSSFIEINNIRHNI